MRINFFRSSGVLILLSSLISCTPEKDNTTSLVGSGYGINSATIFVQNLDSARKFYADILGFDIPKPDNYDRGIYDGTLSVSAYFSDFSSLVLLGRKDSAQVSTRHPFVNSFLTQHEGVRMYSLSTSSADTTHSWLRARGFALDSLQSGRISETPKGWAWDDGGVEWRSVEFNRSNPPAHLPDFVQSTGFPYQEMEQVFKRQPYRVYRRYYHHANGVLGISALRIAVDNLNAAREEFTKMGLTEVDVQDAEHTARFKLPNQHDIYVVAPKSPEDEVGRFLKSRGAGVYALCLEVKSIRATRELLKKKLPANAMVFDSLQKRLTVSKEHAYGVQLEFEEESNEQAAMGRKYDFNFGKKLDTSSVRYAAAIYAKYCSLCHGKDRQGYAADFAPSLRSHSLMSTAFSSNYPNYLKHTVYYGRPGTAMAGYAKEMGGPLEVDDIELLLAWIYEVSGVEKQRDMPKEPVTGDIALGKKLYSQKCAVCHGEKGEGGHAPALGNAMFLATASDAYIRYAISEGRDGTPMRSFKDSLSKTQIDAVTAFVRSRASGWSAPKAVAIKKQLPENFLLNAHHKTARFTLRENQYVSAEQLLRAVKDSVRLVILDARSTAAWHQAHIPGAVSVPYYQEPDTFIKNIPNDSTWVVVYCACPHAASQRVVATLKRFGYQHTAILDEGILVWTQRGYPVEDGY